MKGEFKLENTINKLLENKDFVEKILVMKTPQEIQKAFSDNGVEISVKELEEIAKNIYKLINNPNRKESVIDSELENISGGKVNIHKGLRTAAAIMAGAGALGVGGSLIYVAHKSGEVMDKANAALDSANNVINNTNNVINNTNDAIQGTRSGWFGWFFNMMGGQQ